MFLLPNKCKDKLLTIHLLISYPSLTTEELSSKINRKKRNTKEILKEICNDIKYYLNKEILIKISLEGVISVQKKSSEEMFKLFYALKLAYLEEVHEFKLLLLLIQNPIISTSEISKTLFLSHSYTKRVIKKLNIHLQPYDFELSEKKGICQLIGNELSIRLFLYVLMDDTYNSLTWPNKEITLPQTVSFNQSSLIIMNILDKRRNSKYKIPNLCNKIKWVATQMKIIYNFIPDLKLQNIYFEKILNEAVIEEYFIIFNHICAPQIIPKKAKIDLGIAFMAAPSSLSLFSKNLSSKIITKFHLQFQEEKKHLLVYYLTILDCLCEIMGEKAVLFEELIFPPLHYTMHFEKSRMDNILLFLNNFLSEEFHNNYMKNEKIKYYFCGLIYTILQIEDTPIIRIYLYFTKSFTAQDLIQTRLETIYNPETILFTTSLYDSDLIITDSVNYNKKLDKKLDKEFIYFNTILKQDQWRLLLKKINQLVLRKL